MPKSPLPQLSFELLTANIRAAYYAAKQYPSLFEQGLNWYNTAKLEAEKIARRNGATLDIAIGVISALSPRNAWSRNLIDTEMVLQAFNSGRLPEDIKVCTFHANKLKAFEIASGKLPLDTLTSNKTRCFYLNILDPKRPDIVTIDGHATHIALDYSAPLDNAPALSDKVYQIFSQAYMRATAEINADSLERDVIPSQLQAVTWAYYRVIKGIDKSFKV